MKMKPNAACTLFALALSPAVAIAAPTVAHDPVPSWREGEPLRIEATVISDAPVGVELRLREDAAIEWLTLPMVDEGDNVFVGIIDADRVRGQAFDYYLFAADADDPLQSVTSPLMAPDQHHTVAVDPMDAGATGCSTTGTTHPAWWVAVLGAACVRRRRR